MGGLFSSPLQHLSPGAVGSAPAPETSKFVQFKFVFGLEILINNNLQFESGIAA